MSYVNINAFEHMTNPQSPEYIEALTDALAIRARKIGRPMANFVDSEMRRAAKFAPAVFGPNAAQNLSVQAFDFLLSDKVQNALRIAEQAATGALDGLSLGWLDEINGATNAVGYGIGAWATGRENPWQAMRRGYVLGRNNRRQVLQDGLNENPALVNTMQVIGAIASPVNHTNIFGQASMLNHLGRALQNPVVNGSVAGLGMAEGNWKSQLTETLAGMRDGFASSKIAHPLSKNFNYTPQNYTGGNYAHNIIQPVIYKYLTDIEK